MIKRWLKRVYLFPFWLMLGNVDGGDDFDAGDAGDSGDAGDAGSADDGAADDAGDAEVNDDGGDDSGQHDEGDGQDINQQPAEKTVPVKALQAEVKKRQELESRLKAIEEKQAAPPAREPQTIEEHFDVNPAGVLHWIKEQKAAAATVNDYTRVDELEQTRINLLERQVLLSGQRESEKTQAITINAEMERAVPGFSAKREAIQQTAIKLGLTKEDAADIFNPSVVGPAAVRMAKAFAKAHEIMEAGEKLKLKGKPSPNTVEGSGGPANSGNGSQPKTWEQLQKLPGDKINQFYKENPKEFDRMKNAYFNQ